MQFIVIVDRWYLLVQNPVCRKFDSENKWIENVGTVPGISGGLQNRLVLYAMCIPILVAMVIVPLLLKNDKEHHAIIVRNHTKGSCVVSVLVWSSGVCGPASHYFTPTLLSSVLDLHQNKVFVFVWRMDQSLCGCSIMNRLIYPPRCQHSWNNFPLPPPPPPPLLFLFAILSLSH